MDQETQQLVIDVMDGNPGALMIIQRLMYFSTWCPLLYHLKMQGLIGSKLWRIVQDDYAEDWCRFGQVQLAEMGLLEPVSSGISTVPTWPRCNWAGPLPTTRDLRRQDTIAYHTVLRQPHPLHSILNRVTRCGTGPELFIRRIYQDYDWNCHHRIILAQ